MHHYPPSSPTCIPASSLPLPRGPDRENPVALVAGQGPASHPWAKGQGHGPQGLVAFGPTLAMPPCKKSTPGTLTRSEHDARVGSVPWGYDGPQKRLPACACLLPIPFPRERGLPLPPPGLCREAGGCCGGRRSRMLRGVLSSSSFLVPAPSSPSEPKGERKTPPQAGDPWMPVGRCVPPLCFCLL